MNDRYQGAEKVYQTAALSATLATPRALIAGQYSTTSSGSRIARSTAALG